MRITCNGPARLGAAILPVPAADKSAYQGRGYIHGGLEQVPAPSPPVPQSWNRALSRSSDAPDYWRPDRYWLLTAGNNHPQVSYRSDNQMPVPAINLMIRQAVMMRTPPRLRQRQVGQPVVAPRYPWRR